MIRGRRSSERGHFDHGWLKTFHSFSFAGYHDRAHMGFRSLRVINEDWIEGGEGFGMHGHENMEIVTYVLEGALAHRDSLGTERTIEAGELQRMTAGLGHFAQRVQPVEHGAGSPVPDLAEAGANGA